MPIKIPFPELQVNFSFILSEIRSLYLQDALMATVQSMDIAVIDRELAEYVPSKYLSLLAGRGLRGELVFAVPCIIEATPRLLGYYRLLLGFSQKAFYSSELGISSFAGMENKGIMSKANKEILPELCRELVKSACGLLDGINTDFINHLFLDDLTLLTLGPQLRGGANVKRGTKGIITVFKVIFDIVKHAVIISKPNYIEINNAAGRKVLIEFSFDPDIMICE
jgi:hypothetical protein